MEAYLGQIKLFAGNYAPADWAICDGSVYQIAQYQALFALIGNRWGGDGSRTFGIPDLRGRIPVGQGAGFQLTPRTIGQFGGASTVSLAVSNIPSHTHQLNATNKPGATAAITAGVGLATTARTGTGFLTRYADPTQTGSNAPVYVDMDTLSIAAAGASGPQPHDNLMPFTALTYIICMNGIYPSRP